MRKNMCHSMIAAKLVLTFPTDLFFLPIGFSTDRISYRLFLYRLSSYRLIFLPIVFLTDYASTDCLLTVLYVVTWSTMVHCVPVFWRRQFASAFPYCTSNYTLPKFFSAKFHRSALWFESGGLMLWSGALIVR